MLARIGRAAGRALSLLLRGLLVLVVIEGTASLVGFALAVAEGQRPPEKERLHMRYDPELGWAHVPDTRLEGFYGPGRHLTINAQGIRGKRVYAPQPPEGRLRAICAGDAFTLGTGVDDDDTWCALLERLEPRLETVNLGQGGYGLDQAYLWVRRDGVAFDPDLLLFAFVRDDFGRMEKDTYHHYGKPVLRLGADRSLEIHNVPVPNTGERMPWLVRNAPLFEQLRIVRLARPAIRALRPRAASRLTVGELAELSAGVFEALQRLSDQQAATLVLLYLPTYDDYEQPGDVWRNRIGREARERGIAFVDLVDEMRALPRSEVANLYAPDDAFGPRSGEAPLSEAGNAWVAEALRAHLRRLPELAIALDDPSPEPGGRT